MKNNNLINSIVSFGVAITLFLFACREKDGVAYSDCHIIKYYSGALNYNTPSPDSIMNNMYYKPLTDSSNVIYNRLGISFADPVISDCSKPRSSRLKNSNTIDQKDEYLVELLTDTLLELTIVSNNQYDPAHPTGSSLNDLFLLQKAHLYPSADQGINCTYPIEIEEFLGYKPVGYIGFFLTLSKPPQYESLHTFTIQYKDTYSEFEIKGRPIYIKR